MLGTGEMLIIAVVAIIVVDPKKLPDLMKGLGKAIGEFKQMSGEFKRSMERESEVADFERRKAEAHEQLFGDKAQTPAEAGAQPDAQQAADPAHGGEQGTPPDPLQEPQPVVAPEAAAEHTAEATAEAAPVETPSPEDEAFARAEAALPDSTSDSTSDSTPVETPAETPPSPPSLPVEAAAAEAPAEPSTAEAAPEAQESSVEAPPPAPYVEAAPPAEPAPAAEVPAAVASAEAPAEAGASGGDSPPPPPLGGDEAVGEGQSGRMSLFGHLADLRKRLTRCAIAVLVGFLGCYAFAGKLMKILMQPMLDALKTSHFIYTLPTEAFFTEMKIAFVAGIFAISPYIFYQIYQFVAPGLYSHEKRWIIPIAFFSALCFTVGALFGYFVVFPFGFEFFASYSNDILTFMPKLDEYLDFVLKLLFAFGIVFELPLFLFFLARLGIVSYEGLKSKRKYAVLAAFILAAALTPPDAISQTMMAVPLCILYEVGIWLAYFFGKKRPKPADEEPQAAA